MLNRIKSGGKKSSLRFKLILFGGIIVLILLGVNFINSWIKNNKINEIIYYFLALPVFFLMLCFPFLLPLNRRVNTLHLILMNQAYPVI